MTLVLIISASSPNGTLLRVPSGYWVIRMILRSLLDLLLASIVLSTHLLIVGYFTLACRQPEYAFLGTQKMSSADYFSASYSASSLSNTVPKALEIYFGKTRPSTPCVQWSVVLPRKWAEVKKLASTTKLATCEEPLPDVGIGKVELDFSQYLFGYLISVT